MIPMLCLDLGTKYVGWALLQADGAKVTPSRHGCIHGGHTALGAHLKSHLLEALQNMDTNRPRQCCVVYEEPVSSPETFFTCQGSIMCKGVVESLCRDFGIPTYGIMPNSIKALLTGNGRASKVDVRKAAEKLLGIKIRGPDAYHIGDAYAAGIAQAMRMNQAKGRSAKRRGRK